jgi:hypothetical protein
MMFTTRSERQSCPPGGWVLATRQPPLRGERGKALAKIVDIAHHGDAHAHRGLLVREERWQYPRPEGRPSVVARRIPH